MNQYDHETEVKKLNCAGDGFAYVEAVDAEDTNEQPEQKHRQLLLIANLITIHTISTYGLDFTCLYNIVMATGCNLWYFMYAASLTIDVIANA